MLKNTFIHIPGIGKTTEKRLWSGGIRNWDSALKANLQRDINPRLARILDQNIPGSIEALDKRNFSFFARLLKQGEAWRLYPELSGQCAFLDIETTGLSPYFDQITLVGIYDGKQYKAFVRGKNLNNFVNEIEKYSMVVTFNGSLFDLKFIRFSFPRVLLPPVHVDLRFVTRRIGLTGGLKEVENRLRIRRPKELERISGYDATVLWSRHLRGDKAALDTLIRYNMQDVVNLRPIIERSYETLRGKLVPYDKLSYFKGRLHHPVLNSKTLKTPSVARRKQEGKDRTVADLLLQATRNGHPPRIVGIDLTGSHRRASGWAIMSGELAATNILRTDKEIINETLAAKPDLVSIDSPLSLPVGYPNHEVIYRQCELTLKRMGISVFWCLLPSMQSLTKRGIRLAKKLRRNGIHVIESYPGAAQDLLLIPRKKASIEELKWGLVHVGFKGDWIKKKTSHDELDAITAALVGLFFLAGQYWALGNPKEDYLIIPRTPHLDMDQLIKRFGSHILKQ